MAIEQLQLSDLPPVLLAQALEFTDLRALLALECTSASIQQLIRDFHLWRQLMRHMTSIAKTMVYGDAIDSYSWKRVVRLAELPAENGLQLLHEVRECSSVDNPGEKPENTLTRSSCAVEVDFLSRSVLAEQPLIFLEWAQRIQLRCGCARGSPCYWSTAASWKHASEDYIEYKMNANCLVSAVEVSPYRVFWYPGSPTYSPLQISFTFHELQASPDGDEMKETLGPAVYESPVYDAIRDMKVRECPTYAEGRAYELQEFELPRKVFLRHGVLRLNLFDRQQDLGEEMMQWHRANTLPPFYICLSYVGATGRVATEL